MNTSGDTFDESSTANINRGPLPKNNYTIYRNELLRNRELSLAAKGLLLELLSYPSDWIIYTEELMRDENGKRSIQSALHELEREGYYTVHKYATKGFWKWVKRIYAVPVPADKRTWKPNKKEKEVAKSLDYIDSLDLPTSGSTSKIKIESVPRLPLSASHPYLAKEADGWDPSQTYQTPDGHFPWKCKEGHSWEMKISERIDGHSCPYCLTTNHKGFNRGKSAHFYVLKSSFDNREVIQYGISNNIKSRLYNHKRTGFVNPPLAIISFPLGWDAWRLEQILIETMAAHNVPSCSESGFIFDGSTESFFLDDLTHEFHYEFQILTGVVLIDM